MVKSFSSKNLKEHNQYEDIPDWMDGLVKITTNTFKETKALTLRPVTPFIMMARHWPKSLMTGKDTPPLWCPNFSSVTQAFDDQHDCVMHRDFGDRWKAQKCIIFGGIVREWQEDGKKNPVGYIVLPATVSQTIVQIVGINKYDISDPVKGCDLSIVYNATAQPAQRWSIQRVDRTPLTEAEQSYKVADLEKISPDFGDAKALASFNKEAKRRLVGWAYYVSPLENGEEGWKAYKKDPNGQPYTDFPELVALVGDGKRGEGDDDGKGKGKGKEEKKLKRPHDVVDDEDEVPPKKSKRPPDDDDDASEDDEDSPPPKKSKRPADDEDDEDAPPAKKKPADDDDDDEDAPPPKKAKKPADDDEDEASDDDDEDAPPPKKSKRPADDDDEDAPPPKKSKKPAEDDEEDEDEAADEDEDEDLPPPKKVKKPPTDEDEDEAPKKKKAKDEESEAPFDPDEKPKKLKQIEPREGSEEWSDEFSIKWKLDEDGDSVPKCFGVFANAKKCSGCPVKKACKTADAG